MSAKNSPQIFHRDSHNNTPENTLHNNFFPNQSNLPCYYEASPEDHWENSSQYTRLISPHFADSQADTNIDNDDSFSIRTEAFERCEMNDCESLLKILADKSNEITHLETIYGDQELLVRKVQHQYQLLLASEKSAELEHQYMRSRFETIVNYYEERTYLLQMKVQDSKRINTDLIKEIGDLRLCPICMMNSKNAVLDCGHAICRRCQENLLAKPRPTCRECGLLIPNEGVNLLL